MSLENMSGSTSRLPKKDRPVKAAKAVDPGDAKYRVRVTPFKAASDFGMGPEQILFDQGYRRDPATVVMGDDDRPVSFDMVVDPARFEADALLANRQAMAADAPRPRLNGHEVEGSGGIERLDADGVRSFMGDDPVSSGNVDDYID